MGKTIILGMGLVFCAMHVYAQHTLTVSNSMLRDGDIFTRERIEWTDNGSGGKGMVWDFRNVKVLDKHYQTIIAEDSSKSIRVIEPKFMTLYRLRNDTLQRTGLQSSLACIQYDTPMPELCFPMHYGASLSSDFTGSGRYCRKNALVVRGRVSADADGEGTILLTESDTLCDVLRIHTIMTYTVRTYADTTTNSLASLTTVVEEHYRWYAKGYHYPVFETVSLSYYSGGKSLRCDKTAYRVNPDNLPLFIDRTDVESEKETREQGNVSEGSVMEMDVSISGTTAIVRYGLTAKTDITAILSD